MAEYSVENMKKLAQAVVDAMTIADLQRVVYEQTYAGYEEDKQVFDEDWQEFLSPIKPKGLTPAVIRSYVLHGGEMCPHCQEPGIQVGKARPRGLKVIQDVTCQNPRCRQKWYEIYLLTDITGSNPNDFKKPDNG